MKLSTLTDIGVKRKDNQDNYWASRLEVDGSEVGVICLCDGMGGLKNGELASRVVVNAVKDYFQTDDSIKDIESTILRASDTIYNMGISGGYSSGTTCTLLKCTGGIYEVLHIGDSRCYKISKEGVVEKISTDHSVVQRYKDKGIELPDDMLRKYKNTLLRSLGVSNKCVLDYYTGTYTGGDVFLLCSDGFWHLFEESGRVLSLDYLSSLKDVFSDCIKEGETDNITAGLLYI